MGEGEWETTLKSLEGAYGCTLEMRFSTNEVSNTSQLVMVLGKNENNHSQAFPCKVCANNRHVTLSSMRLKTSHVILNLNKCCSAFYKVFPKNVENFSIEMSSI
jgi:hypothetical protein